MSIVLMTTTGNQEDVNAALGLPPDQAAAEGATGVQAKADEYPAAAADPATEPAAEGAAPAEEPAAAVDDDPDGDGDTDVDEEGEPGTERAARSSHSKLQTIKKLRRRSRDAETRAALLEGELASERRMREELQRVATGQPAAPGASAPAAAASPAPAAAAPVAVDPSDPEPQYEAFADEPDQYAAHNRAVAAWAARQEFRRLEAARTALSAEEQARQKVGTRIRSFIEAHPDYPDVVKALPPCKSQAVFDTVTDPDNENGPALTYYLGQHLDEFARLNALPPVQAIKALGVIESQLAKPAPAAGKPAASAGAAPAAPVPRAPQPPTPVRTAAAPSSLSLEEQAKHITPGSNATSDWIARRNAEVARKGGL
jgi:hypothetical protein